ncbi:TMEM175 family protein [Luteibacter aegosomatissinici]|uniref:TMEM175 family protein n=1 Tax=Luteibacter aegosomatissinici TaxID=2911539 RepID=UPI001FF809E9|nr:TMEM175 family protein [Luteibacter aegosomatissinici]UPG94705.1 TMEM175 family protein [Luteibacter aegosomatissinici]
MLVIEIHVPDVPGGGDDAWLQALAHLVPHFLGYLLSFVVVGALWAAHHRVFGMLQRFDPAIVWRNLALLMSVAFMPFSSALMSTHPTERVPEMFYSLNLFIAGLLQWRLFRTALRAPFIAEGVRDEDVAAMKRRTLALPLMSTLSFILAFWIPGMSNVPLVLMPVIVTWFARGGIRRRTTATTPLV